MTAEDPRYPDSDPVEAEAAASAAEQLPSEGTATTNGGQSAARAAHQQQWYRWLTQARRRWQHLWQLLKVRNRLWLGGLVILGVLVVVISSFTASEASESVSKGETAAVQSGPASTLEPAEAMEVMPDPQLIANIQAQVADITATYAEDLIQSVQAEFDTGILTIYISDDWYSLMRSQQTRLSQDLLQRAQELAFSKLYLRDPQGNLVARNPVIGSNMVILQRDPPPSDEPTGSYLFRLKVGDDTELSWPQ